MCAGGSARGAKFRDLFGGPYGGGGKAFLSFGRHVRLGTQKSDALKLSSKPSHTPRRNFGLEGFPLITSVPRKRLSDPARSPRSPLSTTKASPGHHWRVPAVNLIEELTGQSDH